MGHKDLGIGGDVAVDVVEIGEMFWRAWSASHLSRLRYFGESDIVNKRIATYVVAQ